MDPLAAPTCDAVAAGGEQCGAALDAYLRAGACGSAPGPDAGPGTWDAAGADAAIPGPTLMDGLSLQVLSVAREGDAFLMLLRIGVAPGGTSALLSPPFFTLAYESGIGVQGSLASSGGCELDVSVLPGADFMCSIAFRATGSLPVEVIYMPDTRSVAAPVAACAPGVEGACAGANESCLGGACVTLCGGRVCEGVCDGDTCRAMCSPGEPLGACEEGFCLDGACTGTSCGRGERDCPPGSTCVEDRCCRRFALVPAEECLECFQLNRDAFERLGRTCEGPVGGLPFDECACDFGECDPQCNPRALFDEVARLCPACLEQ